MVQRIWQLLLDWWFWVTDVIDTTCPKTECCLLFFIFCFSLAHMIICFDSFISAKSSASFQLVLVPKWSLRVDIHPAPPGSMLAGRGTCPPLADWLRLWKNDQLLTWKKAKPKKTRKKRLHKKRNTQWTMNPIVFFDGTQSDTNHHESFAIGRFAPSLVLWLINLRTDWFNPGRNAHSELCEANWSSFFFAAKMRKKKIGNISDISHVTTLGHHKSTMINAFTTFQPSFRSLHDWPNGRQCYWSRILGFFSRVAG